MDTKLKSFRFSIWFKSILMFFAFAGFMSAICFGMLASYEYQLCYNFFRGEPEYQDEKYASVLHTALSDLLSYYIYPPGKFRWETQEDLRLYEYQHAIIKKRVDSYINLRYLVIDLETGQHYTNLANAGADEARSTIMACEYAYEVTPMRPELLTKERRLEYEERGVVIYSYGDAPQYEVYMTVAQPLSPGDQFYASAAEYDAAAAGVRRYFLLSMLGLAAFIICAMALVGTAGRNRKDDELHMLPTDRLYNDLAFALVVLLAIITLKIGIGDMISDSVSSTLRGFVWGSPMISALSIIALALAFVLLAYYTLSIARHVKNRSLLKHTLVYSVFQVAGRAFRLATRSGLRGGTVAFILGYGLFSAVCTLTACVYYRRNYTIATLMFFLWLIVSAVGLAAMIKRLSELDGIMNAVRQTARSGHAYEPPAVGEHSPFTEFSESIAAMQRGYGEAVDRAVRGERLKAELVTNVSHDLKTPLTSIINYVELLKKEPGLPAPATEYIAVLDQKSQRLRRLCDDLFEAAKATTGNVSSTPEAVNMYELLRQAEGEYADAIAAAGLDIRVTSTEAPVVVRADRQHMSRVVENLLSNLIKYAMPGSRVYVELINNGSGHMIMKNISKDALNIPAELLTERFVRGDKSRSEEGSGLGLAIARGLCEAQGGRLEIFVEGDLFRSEVILPLWQAAG